MAEYDITIKGSGLEFDTTDASYPVMAKLSATRFITAWMQSGGLLLSCYDLNTSTGAITQVGSSTFPGYSLTGTFPIGLLTLTSSRVFAIYADASDTYCETFPVDGSGNISSPDSETLVTNQKGNDFSAVLLDSTHVFVCFRDSEGTTTVFMAVITLTGVGGSVSAITTTSTISNVNVVGNCVKISSSKVLINYVDASNDAHARVVDINNSTWAITPGADTEIYDSATVSSISAELVDQSGLHAVVGMIVSAGTTTGRVLQTITLDTSADTVTALGSLVQLNTFTDASKTLFFLNRVDDTHFTAFSEVSGGTGVAYSLSLNNTTGAISSVDTDTFGATQTKQLSSLAMDTSLFVVGYKGASDDGFFQVFEVTMPISGPANLKSYNTNLKANIKTINTNAIANVKSLDTNV